MNWTNLLNNLMEIYYQYAGIFISGLANLLAQGMCIAYLRKGKHVSSSLKSFLRRLHRPAKVLLALLLYLFGFFWLLLIYRYTRMGNLGIPHLFLEFLFVFCWSLFYLLSHMGIIYAFFLYFDSVD